MKLSSFNLLNAGMLLFLSAIVVSGCQDPILVGSGLLDDEKINVEVMHDFDIASSTVEGTKVITRSSASKTYRLGAINDPIFGKMEAEMYMKFGFNVSTTPAFSVEATARFDSLVLVLSYDTLATFGQPSGLQHIQVYQLDEAYKSTDTFYSDTKLSYLPTPILDKTIFIKPTDSITILEHGTGKTLALAPQLRLRLDDTFAKTIFDNETLVRDSLFRDFFKGIYITSQSADGNPFMYGFDMSSTALSATNPSNKLIMYYTVSDTIGKAYDFAIDNAVINRYNLEHTGSVVGSFLNNPQLGDSLVFVQGFGGVKTEISFKDLDKANNLLINKAELEVFVADIPGWVNYTATPPQLIATIKNAQDKYEFIEDIARPLSLGTSFVPAFNGVPVRVQNGYKYKMNITNHLKKAFKDPSFSPTLYISVLTESENPNRVAFYGAKHSTYPVKLSIYYTKN